MSSNRSRRSHVLGVDSGTTGVTALIVDETASVVARGYREFRQSFPRPGWIEHDPEDWWNALAAASADALEFAELAPTDLAAIGITNQRETTVVWDRETLAPYHPAIVWQDRRTAELCATLREEGLEPLVRERTGLVIDPYFSATKLHWLLENVEGAREAAAAGRLAFGTVDAYLLARLTAGAVHATDYTNASRTMLYDIRRRRWDPDLLARMDIPPAILPQVMPSSGRFGTTAAESFVGVGVPIAGVAGDQQAALFGQACFQPGSAKNTYGTGSFVLLHTGTDAPTSEAGLLTTIAYGDESTLEYALEGSIFVTGAAIQWLRDGLGIIEHATEAGPLAASVADTGDVYFVPAMAGLGAPYWDPYARGTLVGVTRGTTRAHVTRAVVEAMAFQTRDVVDAMRRDSPAGLTELKADGGASVMDVLLQFQADVLGVPVRRSEVLETTAVGAAFLAGLGVGVWTSREELAGAWHLGKEFTPGDTVAAEDRHRRWLLAVERSRGWATS